MDAATENSRPVTSAKICIRSRFRSGSPPQATIRSTATPASANASTMTRVPKAVASSSAR